MAHYGTLRDYRFSDRDVSDIRGATLYGQGDQKLGKIDDVIFGHTTGSISYIVVDTGGWLSSKKFIVPADRLALSTKHEDDYFVQLTKEQIESFPPYDESDLGEQNRWTDYETRYRNAWTDSPIQHREGSDRNISPAAWEVASIATTGASSGMSSAAERLGSRWHNFEERLRRDRNRIVSECNVCRPSAQPAERRDRERKVG